MRKEEKNYSKKDHFKHCALYEFNKGSTAVQAHSNITETYNDFNISLRTIQRWFIKFRKGENIFGKKENSGRPEKYDSSIIDELVRDNPFLTLKEMSNTLDIPETSIYNYLKRLGKVNKLGSFIPYNLNESQKKKRFDICKNLISKNESDPFLKRIITGDEKWVLYKNISRKRQWIDKYGKPKPTPKNEIQRKKVLLSIFWDYQGIVFFELIEKGKTIDSDIYSQQLLKLNEKLIKKRPALMNRKIPLLLHDNAKPHVSKNVQETLDDLGWEILPHPPYSPDIAPSDFYLFRTLQNDLNGREFKNMEDMKIYLKEFFDSHPRSFYRKGIGMLPERWKNVIDSNGEYFDF